MNSKTVLLVKALISVVLALLLLFLPSTFGGWFGLPSQDVGNLMARFFGVALLGIGLICYVSSSATASALRKNVILSLFITDTIGFILALIAQLQGAFNGLGWLIVALWLILALLLGYSYFLNPED